MKYVITFDVDGTNHRTKVTFDMPPGTPIPDDADSAGVILLAQLLGHFNDSVRYHLLEAIKIAQAQMSLEMMAAKEYTKQ